MDNRMQYPGQPNTQNQLFNGQNPNGRPQQQQQQYGGGQYAAGGATRFASGGGMMQQPQSGQDFNPTPNHNSTASATQQSPRPAYNSNPSTMAQAAAPNPTVMGAPAQASEAQANIERQRVTLLLDINTVLLQEIVTMQERGDGGEVQSPNKQGEDAQQPSESKVASKEYVECMRRMQANLAYLANVAERSNRPQTQVLPHPPIMIAPASPPSLVEKYAAMQSLFPAWKAAAQAKQGQAPNAANAQKAGAD